MPNVKVEHINPFIKATIESFSTMIGVTLKPGKIQLKDTASTIHDISGIIGLSGGARGAIAISFPKACALDVVSKFIGEEINDINEDVTDAIGELANIIAGYAKKDLTEFSIQISLPSVITGEGHKVSDAKDVTAMVIPFTYDSFSFDLGVALVSNDE
ncbi:MAG: chemotaxis protein CheX [Fibrobacterales bacterium]